ncbi:MAG: mechanosensitive ion channel [Rubrivivax sp.]|nr:mechanosensitive ion channel [Rubrivivax sp.]
MDTLSRFIDSLGNSMSAVLGPYAPRVLGALALLAAAWLGARLARAATMRLAARARLDERLSSPGLAATLAGIAAAGVWLLALPALLGTLELQGLLTPVNAMLSRLLAFVPNLLGAVVVLGIGVLIARIARQVVSGLARAAGSEKLAEKLGLAASLGPEGLAGIAGQIVFVLLLLPTTLAALQPLGLEALTQPLSRLLETLVNLVPRLLSATLVVGVAVLVGRALANLASAALAAAGLDRLPERLGAGPLRLAGRSPSELAGGALMLAVVLVAVAQATEILGLPVLTEIVAVTGAALARLAVAAVILVAGVLLASLAARALEAGTLPNARALGWVARGAILFFSSALALRQAGLPAEIVAIAFGAVVGAVAIAVAVAFGVGGRDVAARVLDRVAASFEPPGGGSARGPADPGP